MRVNRLDCPEMDRISLSRLKLETTNPFAGLPRVLGRVLFGLFAAQYALVWAKLWPGFTLFGQARWPDGVLMVLATAATLAALGRQLPGQNVMLAAIIIAVIAGAAQSLGALTGIPFGPYVYTERAGQQLFNPLPWAVPMLWIVAVVNSRGVARLILRPWRKGPNYGLWLIGLSALLVVLLDLGLEPFSTNLKRYWFWNPTKIPFDWYTTPLVNFVGWAVTALLILAFATPALINKKPVKFPPDYYPLALWLMLNVLFLTGAALHRLWAAAAVIAAQTLLAAIFAIRGARR
jgi:uncharacterized membrane protein